METSSVLFFECKGRVLKGKGFTNMVFVANSAEEAARLAKEHEFKTPKPLTREEALKRLDPTTGPWAVHAACDKLLEQPELKILILGVGDAGAQKQDEPASV